MCLVQRCIHSERVTLPRKPVLSASSSQLITTSNPPPSDVKIIYGNTHVCDGPHDVKLLIYVHSDPEHSERRMRLRETWANQNLFLDKRVRTVFFIGHPSKPETQNAVRAENTTYGDIIQGDFEDSYKNLTLKGLLAFKWLTQHCQNAKFALKADDDAFVNIFEILDVIDEDYVNKNRTVVCAMWPDNSMPILRNPKNCMKWCVPEEDFPGQRFYPKYCAGLTYLLPMPIIGDMLSASKRTPFFWIDDVYITGLLTREAGTVSFRSILDRFKTNNTFVLEKLKQNNTQFLMTHTGDDVQMYRLWMSTLKTLKWKWKTQIDKVAAVQNILLQNIVG